MENIAISLIIGITSSMIATAVFIFLSELIRRTVLPWYADKIYRGVRIDGKWVLVKNEGNDIPEKDELMTFDLTQKGDTITGTYTHKLKNEIDLYRLNGFLRDMYFSAIAMPMSNRQIDAASFLFYVEYEGSRLHFLGGVLYKGKPGEVKAWQDLNFALSDS